MSRGKLRYAVAAGLWCLAALLVKPFYPYLDFDVFYATAVERVLAGRPLDIYGFVGRPAGSDIAYPLTHPPLYIFYLAPFQALGGWLGISDFHRSVTVSLGQAWMLLASFPFDLLMVVLALGLAERARGRLPEPRRFLVFAGLLASPVLWLTSVRYGHNESMMVAMVLLAVLLAERERPWLCGACWGLALSLKLTAVVPALGFFGWSLARRPARLGLPAAGMAGLVFGLPLVPYLVLRPEQTWYALVEFSGQLPVGGYVLWKLSDFPAWMIASWAPATLLGAAAFGVWCGRRRGANGFVAAGGIPALILGQVLFLLLSKVVFVWYGLLLTTLCYVAFLPRPGGRSQIPVVPLLASLLAWLLQSDWVGEATSPEIRLRSGLWVSFLLVVGGLALRQLRASTASPRPAGS